MDLSLALFLLSAQALISIVVIIALSSKLHRARIKERNYDNHVKILMERIAELKKAIIDGTV